MARRNPVNPWVVGGLLAAGLVVGAAWVSTRAPKKKRKKAKAKETRFDPTDGDADDGGFTMDAIPAKRSQTQREQMEKDVTVVFERWWADLPSDVQAVVLSSGVGPSFQAVLDAYDLPEGTPPEQVASKVASTMRLQLGTLGHDPSPQIQALVENLLGARRAEQLYDMVAYALEADP